MLVLTCGLAVVKGAVFWLLQGGRDGGADELEGLALGAGRLGEHRDGGGCAVEADLVAGQGGQVGEQAAEAAVAAAVLVVLAGGLGPGGRGAPGGGGPGGGVGRGLSGGGARGPGAADGAGQVGAAEASQHLGPYPLF